MKKTLLIIIASLLPLSSWSQEAFTLEACKALALENSFSIFEKNNMKEMAALDSKLAKASRYPSLNLNGVGSSTINAPSELLPAYYGLVSADVNMVLYAGGKINQSIALAQMGEEVREEQIRLSKQEVVLRTEELYWNALKLKEQIKLAEAQLAALQKLEKELLATVEVGLAQKNDLLKVQVGKNGVDLKRGILEDQLRVVKKALQQHIGISLREPISLADSIINIEGIGEINQDALAQKAISQRPELSLLEKQVQMEVKKQRITDADYLPQVGLRFSAIGLFTEETTLGEPFPPVTLLESSSTFMIPQIGISVPIFQAGSRQFKRQKHQLQTQVYQEHLKDAQEKINVEVYQSWVAWKAAYNTVKVNELSVEQAAENLRLYRDQFEAGLVNGSDVLDAQFLWEEAQFNVISGKADFKIKEAQLQKVIGGL